jgi:uncharacterized protein (DUF2062 family)
VESGAGRLQGQARGIRHTQPRRWLRGLWDRALGLILQQLRQGTGAREIALTLALGLALTVFPIFGSTATLCLLTGLALRLNQPLLQLVNWCATPLQFPAIYFFIRVGERLTHAPAIPFSIPDLIERFRTSPAAFMREFGMTGVRGILAWALIAPPLAAALYLLLLPPLRRLAGRRA